jgi:two-component system KDP operon response regulator KdpE
MALVLVVEDDVAIRTALVRGLTERGHATCSSGSGMGALSTVLTERPDLVVLDLGLPDVDGQEVLRMIRAVSAVPVVVATARDDDRAVVAALDAGADDYLVKPFKLEQLEARIRAVLRRTRVGEAPVSVVVGDLVVDPGAREVFLDGHRLALSAKEFDLLLYLAVRAGQVVSKQELLVEVWRRPYGGADKTVDVHLSWLRRKLGEPATAPRYLHTVRGVGVKLTAAT